MRGLNDDNYVIICYTYAVMIQSTTKKDKSNIILTITTDGQFIDPYKQAVLKKLKKDLKVDGFRPGHAPDNIVIRELGEARVQAEVLEEVIEHATLNQLREQKIESLSSPKIELKKFVPYTELEFTAEIAVMPEIKFDYSKLKLKKEPIKIEPEKVDEMVENLRKQMAKRTATNKPAKKGDEIRFDFEGSKDGKLVEGAGAKNHAMLIGEGTFIPGFEENLIGLKEKDEKTFDVTFPKDYHAQDLQGAKVQFKVKVNSIYDVELPKVDDAFAKSVGNKPNIQELRADIEQVLAQQEQEQADKHYENQLLEMLFNEVKFDVPSQLLEDQAIQLEQEMDKNLHNSGMDRKKYLEIQKRTEDDLKKEINSEAERRVKGALVLRDVIKKYDLKVSEIELEQELAKMAEQYKSDSKIQEELTHGHFKEDLRNHLLTRKAVGKLTEFATK